MASDSRSSNDDSLSSPTHISNPSSEAGSHQKRHRYQAKAALTVWKDLLHRRSSSKIPSLRDTITHPHLDCTENMKFSREYEPHSAKPKRESGDESQSVSSQDPLADFDPAKLLPDLELSPILPSQYSHAGLNAVSSAKTRGEKPLDGETAYGEGREDPQRSYPLSPNREGSTKDESTSIVEDWMQSIQFMPNLASSSTSDLTTFYNEVR
jgi:hypothetical protein